MKVERWRIREMRLMTLVFSSVLLAGFVMPLSGCKRPRIPKLTGEGRFHDLTQLRRGMTPNEVRRIMGSKYKSHMDEGLKGRDMGIWYWQYPEGKVYFDYQGVFKVESSR